MRMERPMSKQRINITVDPAVVERARRYTERHGTSISRLVTEYLAQLPLEDEAGVEAEERLTPTVRRLLGVARGGGDREGYRQYLVEKYGR
jgi:hypothetical protein